MSRGNAILVPVSPTCLHRPAPRFAPQSRNDLRGPLVSILMNVGNVAALPKAESYQQFTNLLCDMAE